MIAPRVHDNRPFALLAVSGVVLAWTVLIAWGASPYGRFLSHDAIGDLGETFGPAYLAIALVFVLAWVIMTVAMMLPTALPLVLLFQRLVATRSNASLLIVLVVTGYLLVWALFGVIAHAGDLGIHRAVARSHWLADRAWLISAATMFVAGVYQFTPLKYFCLDKCRSPYSFIQSHWHGRTPNKDALLLGIHHGVYCVGCCWSLMLLMFAFGVGNVAWMLALGLVMGIEKNLPWGRRLSTPLGVLLIGAAIGIAFASAGTSPACAHADGSGC
jgi:predicted metal-binding membrane protein